MMLFASPCQPSRRRMHMDFVHTVVHLRRVKRKALCCSTAVLFSMAKSIRSGLQT